MVVSNHRDANAMASYYKVPFHFLPLDSLDKARMEDGATSRYRTENLDDGPINEQDVTCVSLRDQVAESVQKGRDLERLVPSRAVRWHLNDRILFYDNKTVVFD